MPHRGRSFRRGISDSQRRKKSWVQVTGPATDGVVQGAQTPNMRFVILGSTPVGSSFSASIGLFSDPVLDKIPEESTLLRLRGSLNLPKNAVSGFLVTNFAFAIGVMEAGAAGLGAFPNPATPEGGAWDGWMYYRSQQQGSLDANAGIVDVKAMRKMHSGSAIVAVFGQFIVDANGATIGPTSDIEAQLNLRALILLP